MIAKVLLVGCGKMGHALLQGWIKQGDIKELIIVDPYPPSETCPNIKKRTDLKDVPHDWQPDIVVFAIKPQVCSTIAPLYKKYNKNKATLFVSIVAGQTIERWEEYLGKPLRMVRVMPNLPATVGQGISALYAHTDCDKGDQENIADLFEAVGQVITLDHEEDLHAVTAISGSGPAYVYLFIEALQKAAEHQGLSKELAQKLVEQTIRGAMGLLDQTGVEPTLLRQQVTSPGGTTQAALEVLCQDQSFMKLINKAVAAAANRSRELS